MIRNWYLIDDDGFHPIATGGKRRGDFWTTFNRAQPDEVWPPFTQLVADASPQAVRQAITAVAEAHEVHLVDVTAHPDAWSEGLYLANKGGVTLVGEPLTELEERFISPVTAEDVIAALGCAGAFFGYDPACATLHLTMFEAGRPTFTWCDSLLPGPSLALIFHADGTSTYEDPRHFALRMMDIPLTSPLLDRYAFVEANLRSLGVDPVCPDLQDLPIAAVLQVEHG